MASPARTNAIFTFTCVFQACHDCVYIVEVDIGLLRIHKLTHVLDVSGPLYILKAVKLDSPTPLAAYKLYGI
jgi:hypothetical protein